MPNPTHARIPVWNKFEADLANLCLEDSVPLGTAVGIVARRYTDDAADSLMLASVSFCTNYDHVFGFSSENSPAIALVRYQLIAALAADIAAIGTSERTCANLVEHWVVTDDRLFASS